MALLLFRCAAPFADAVHPMSGPGCWAYPDMLEVGVAGQNGKSEGGLTPEEERTHLGLWQVRADG